jgi:flagellar basal-body rod protein FlgG
MNHSMINAGVTMNSLQRKLDLIAYNLANLNTAGYKRQDASFDDLLTSIKAQQNKTLPGRLTPPVLPIGSGARLTGIKLDLSEGSLTATGNPLDLALQGDVLFEIGVPAVVQGEDGEPQIAYEAAWTRNGAFRLSPVGDEGGNVMLTNASGYPVLDVGGAPIVVPAGSDVTVDRLGNVLVKTPEQDEPALYTTLKLVRVTRADLLEAKGENLYAYPAELMEPAVRATLTEEIDLNFPDAEQSGIAVLSGHLESSNVDLITEMTELINVQRAYQLNARALASSDEMMSIANRLRG